MRTSTLVWLLLAVAALGGSVGAAPQAPDARAAQRQRLAWFREAKFGLFIHWGLYAIPAGEWKGQSVPGIGEWIMNRARIPVGEYEQLTKVWNPLGFNAEEWVRLAQDAGMRYLVITAKHHDGFALYDSKASAYNVVAATPFRRDVLKELSDACSRHHLRLGFYYSQAQDWHEPNGAGNDWDFGPDEGKDFEQYLRTKAEPQVRELLSGYGPVSLVWFDTPRLMTGDRAQRFVDIVRSLQPECLIDGRLGTAGDYVTTGDNVIPPEVEAQAWETPATINHTWGFRKDDQDWKAPGDLIFKLLDIVSKGGNYLLNVGPTADGIIPPASQDILRTVGRWLKKNGEAVYGAGPTPFGEELGEPSALGTLDLRGHPLFLVRKEWRVTTKPGRLYFTFFEEPRVPFPLPALKNKLGRAYRLGDGVAVETKVDQGRTFLVLPRPLPDPTATVVVVEFEGERVER